MLKISEDMELRQPREVDSFVCNNIGDDEEDYYQSSFNVVAIHPKVLRKLY